MIENPVVAVSVDEASGSLALVTRQYGTTSHVVPYRLGTRAAVMRANLGHRVLRVFIEPSGKHDGGALRFRDAVSVQRCRELQRVRSRACASLGTSALGVLLAAPHFRQGNKCVCLPNIAEESALALFACDLHLIGDLIRSSVELLDMSVLELTLQQCQLGGFK